MSQKQIFIIGSIVLCLIAFHFVSSATAESDYIRQVRLSQSEVFDTATKSQNVLREAINQLEYIKAQAHDNATKMDFLME